MPYINLQITKGATRLKRRSSSRILPGRWWRRSERSPEHIHIVIDEVDEENWGFAGMLTDDYRKAHPASTKPLLTASHPAGKGMRLYTSGRCRPSGNPL